MLASVTDWNAVAAIAAVFAVLLSIGAIGGRWWVKHRPGAGMQRELIDLKTQLTDIRTVVGAVSETLTGRTPTAYEPAPPPGLVGIVIHHGQILAEQNKILIEQNKVLATWTPNGGKSKNPGDIMLRLDQDRATRAGESHVEDAAG